MIIELAKKVFGTQPMKMLTDRNQSFPYHIIEFQEFLPGISKNQFSLILKCRKLR